MKNKKDRFSLSVKEKETIEKTIKDAWEYRKDSLSLLNHSEKIKYGDYVVAQTCYLMRKGHYPVQRFLGRAVQIRKNGNNDDKVIIRNADGVLVPYISESFLIVNKKFHPQLDEIYNRHGLIADEGKEGEREYTINGKSPRRGFIVMSDENED